MFQNFISIFLNFEERERMGEREGERQRQRERETDRQRNSVVWMCLLPFIRN